MNVFGLDYFLVLALALIGAFSIVLHNKSYQSLFDSLLERELIGSDYRPDWTSKLGALGCMGFITRLKRELGFENINADEMHLLRRASISYYVGTISTFVAICLLYWRI